MPDPTIPDRTKEIKPPREQADESFDFLDAAEEEVVKTRSEADKNGSKPAGDSASEPAKPGEPAKPADTVEPADPAATAAKQAQEAVRKRVFDTLGKPEGKDQLLDDITEILISQKKDGTVVQDIQSASLETARLSAVRAEIGIANLPSRATLEIANIKDNLKLPNYKAAEAVLAVKGLTGLDTAQAAADYMKNNGIETEHIKHYKELVTKGRIKDSDLGKLVKLGQYVREDFISMIDKEQQTVPIERVSAMLKLDSDSLGNAIKRESHQNLFRALKPENINNETANKIYALKGDAPKSVELFEKLDAADQLAVLSMKGADFDQRAATLQTLEKALGAKLDPKAAAKLVQMTSIEAARFCDAITKNALPADLANEMLEKNMSSHSVGNLSKALSGGIVTEKTAREMLKLEPTVRDGLNSLFSHTVPDAASTEALVKKASDGSLSYSDIDAYRDGSIRLKIDAKTIMAIESRDKADRDALVGILKEQSGSQVPRDQTILGDTFTKLATGNYPKGTLEAIRQNIKSGVLPHNVLDKFVEKPESYRASLAKLMSETELTPEAIKKMAADGVSQELMDKLLTEKRAGRVTSENIDSLMKAELDLHVAIRERMLGSNYDKSPLTSETLQEILKAEPNKTLVEGYFKALDSGVIPSQQELGDILKLPAASRKIIEQGILNGRLDRAALTELKGANFSAEETRRYTSVLAEAKAAGIDQAKFNEAIEYVKLYREYTQGAQGKDAGPATNAEIAFLLLSRGLNPDSAKNFNDMQKLHSKTEALRQEFKLTVGESVELDKFKRDNKSIQIDQKTVDKARELVSDRVLKAEFRDALGAAAIMQQAGYQMEPSSCLSASSEVMKLARRRPDANLEEIYRDTQWRDKFNQLVGKETNHPFDKFELNNPHDPLLTAIELSYYIEGRKSELEAKLKATPRGSAEISQLEKDIAAWDGIGNALASNEGKNSLSDLLTARPELAWQVLKKLPLKDLAELPNYRFLELASSATERLSSLPEGDAIRHTKELVSEFEKRFEGVRPAEKRNFIKTWIETAAQLPGTVNERGPALFRILQNIDSQDLSRLSNEHLRQLSGSITTLRLEDLSLKQRGEILFDLLHESGQPGRNAVKDAIYKDTVPRITAEIIESAPAEDVGLLTEEIKKNLRSEAGLADVPTTSELASEIASKISGKAVSKEIIDSLLSKYSAEDRALALDLLNERAPHLSQAGFIKQLKDFADTLRAENFLTVKATAQSRGRPVEIVKLYSFNDSTSTRALAYQLKKHTGLQVELQVLKPGESLPEEKGVLLEPLSSAPDSVRKTIEASPANFKPAPELASFQKGLNFLHLAAADANPMQAQKHLDQMIADAKTEGRKPTRVADTGPTTDQEIAYLRNKIRAANNEFQARTEAKTLLYFAHKQSSSGSSVQLQALVMKGSLDVVTYDDMIEQAFFLHDQLTNENKVDMSKAYFIVDEKPNSNHLATELYRVATGMEGKEFDGRFISMEQAKKMKGEGLTFIHLNDGIYSGTEVKKNMVKLQELKETTGGRVVSANLLGYKAGVNQAQAAGNEAGVDVVVHRQYEDAYTKAAGLIKEGKISRLLSANPKLAEAIGETTEGLGVREMEMLLGSPEWSAETYKPGEKVTGAKVVSALFLPYMRSNTTARKLGDLADYVDIPRAHTESRGELMVEDIKSQVKDINDPQTRRNAVNDLLKPFQTQAVEEYIDTMDGAFKKEKITNAEDLRSVLREGIKTYAELHQRTAIALGLENKKLDVKFGTPSGGQTSPDGKSLTLVLDPALSAPAQFDKAKVEIMRQILDHRAQDLLSAFPTLEPALFRETLDKILQEKVFQIEHPLKALNDIPGIRRFTEVSESFLVGSAPKANKSNPLAESMQSLKARGVTTIIDLAKNENKAQREWCEANGIKYKHQPIDQNGTLTHDQADAVLAEVSAAKAKKEVVFVQDRTGTDRAPAVVAAYRVQQGLSPESALKEVAERFSFTPADKSKIPLLLEERQARTEAVTPAPAPTPGTTAAKAPSPMSDEKLRLFVDRVESALPESYREELQLRAKQFFGQEGSQSYQRAVRRTVIVSDPALEAGQSKTSYVHEGKPFTPTAFTAEPEPGRFKTADGRTLELNECRIEISVSAKASAQAAASHVAAEYSKLAFELQNMGSVDAAAKAKAAEAGLATLKERLDIIRKGGDPAVNDSNATKEVKLYSEFDVGGRMIDVSLTMEGVKIGDKVYSDKKIVEMAMAERKTKLEKAKDAEERSRLTKELETLNQIYQDLDKGSTTKFREEMAKLIPNEIKEQRKAGPAARGVARVTEGLGRASAYLMIAAFVASLAISPSAQASTDPAYAPLKPR